MVHVFWMGYSKQNCFGRRLTFPGIHGLCLWDTGGRIPQSACRLDLLWKFRRHSVTVVRLRAGLARGSVLPLWQAWGPVLNHPLAVHLKATKFESLLTVEGELGAYCGGKNVCCPLSGNGKGLYKLLRSVYLFLGGCGQIFRPGWKAVDLSSGAMMWMNEVQVRCCPTVKLFVISYNTLPGQTLCHSSKQREISYCYFAILDVSFMLWIVL